MDILDLKMFLSAKVVVSVVCVFFFLLSFLQYSSTSNVICTRTMYTQFVRDVSVPSTCMERQLMEQVRLYR